MHTVTTVTNNKMQTATTVTNNKVHTVTTVTNNKVHTVTTVTNNKVQTVKTVTNNQPDIRIRDNEKKNMCVNRCYNFWDRNAIKKEVEKILK